MAKNTRNIIDNVKSARTKQAEERAKEVDATQQRNPDIASGTVEGLYSKGLPHDGTTLVGDKFEIQKIQLAVDSGSQADFDAISLAGDRKQASPQGSLSSELSGGDPEGFTMAAPPALGSAKAAGEMVEVYLKNIMRDIPFVDYETGASGPNQDLIDSAINLLNQFRLQEDFGAPVDPSTGEITAKTLFRGNSATCLIGGYVSQLYLNTIGVGNFSYEPVGPTDAGDYGVTETRFLQIQEGLEPGEGVLPAQIQTNTGAGNGKYMFNGRQLGSTVHVDLVFQHFYEAAAILLNAKVGVGGQIQVGPKVGNFLGGPVLTTTMLSEVSRHALRAAWVQKWRKHLRLRPEAMAGRIVAEMEGNLPVGTVDSNIFNIQDAGGNSIINLVSTHNSSPTLLPEQGEAKPWLPLQYAEGSPTHPAYPAGHATIAGACATILKIMFANPAWSSLGLGEKQANDDGSATEAYSGSDKDLAAPGDSGTTVHGEIDKLAHNVALGRDFAGVHYRSDSELALGEKVAIQYYKDQKTLFNEEVDLVEFVGFDGETIRV